MTFENVNWAWLDGRIVPWPSAHVHLTARGIQYGIGVFEGLRCYSTKAGPAIFRLPEHVDRLFESAAAIGLSITYSRETIGEAIRETVRRNGLRNAYIRPLCFEEGSRPGLGADGSRTRVAILCWPWQGPYFPATPHGGIRVCISQWRKVHHSMLPATAKACGGYLNSMLAAREARQAGYDEAIMLDQNGFVAEGPTENVFLVRDRALHTNDHASSILIGITRNTVIQLARDLGYRIRIDKLAREDLFAASEVFFTGTAAEITPVREIDGVPIGLRSPGVHTAELQCAFAAATRGESSRYADWLQPLDALTRIAAEG